MRNLLLLFFISSIASSAQQTIYNSKKGYVAEGYDVVAYFDNKAVEGRKEYSIKYDGAEYKFISKNHLETFKANPDKYVPQYGGFCAYAIAAKGKKVGIDPKTFLISDGKLYLFYNAWGTNTLESWQKNDPDKLKQKADIYWKAIMKKK